MLWEKWALIVAGIGIAIDGIGSILLPSNHHDIWYDGERVVRVVAGILIAILGVIVP